MLDCLHLKQKKHHHLQLMMKKNFIIVLQHQNMEIFLIFIMKTQNLKFGEAVKSLANLAGMRPYTFSKQDEEREKNWQEYCSIYNQYVEFYHEEILKNETFNNCKRLFKKKKSSKDEVKKFKIGFVEKIQIFMKN